MEAKALRAQKQLAKVMNKLTSQQEDVVKPLIKQISLREERIQTLGDAAKELTRQIKILTAILKFGPLCD